MKIEVLGTGCHNCITLESLLEQVLVELGKKDYTITRISDEKVIRRYMPLENTASSLTWEMNGKRLLEKKWYMRCGW